MNNTDDIALLHLFCQSSHYLHTTGKLSGQERLLIQLMSKVPITQRELIDIMGRRSATLSEQLENLEKAGCITRTRNELDHRNMDIALTPAGQEAAAVAREARAKRAKSLFSVCSQKEKEQLAALLEKLLSHWNKLSLESEASPK